MKWAGLVTNASPYEVPVGSAVTQVNMQVISPGKLNVRLGNTTAGFSSITATGSTIISAFRYARPIASDSVVYQTADGKVYIAQGPT
jgi:hypothetical protein